jgi:hypothetical protein
MIDGCVVADSIKMNSKNYCVPRQNHTCTFKSGKDSKLVGLSLLLECLSLSKIPLKAGQLYTRSSNIHSQLPPTQYLDPQNSNVDSPNGQKIHVQPLDWQSD